MGRVYWDIEEKKMRYWSAKTKDGKNHVEGSTDWSRIKNDIISLSLIDSASNQIVSLPANKNEYFQAKTASADFTGKNIVIESRYISCKIGNNIMRIRVNETTGNVSVEIE